MAKAVCSLLLKWIALVKGLKLFPSERSYHLLGGGRKVVQDLKPAPSEICEWQAKLGQLNITWEVKRRGCYETEVQVNEQHCQPAFPLQPGTPTSLAQK